MLLKKKKITWIIILFVLALGTTLFFIFRGNRPSLSGSRTPTKNNVGNKGVVKQDKDGMVSYRSERFGFSFKAPEDFTVGEFDEGGGRIVLLNSPDGSETFQIFITSYDESARSLTVERIQSDIPDLKIREPETLHMTRGEDVLSFIGEDSVFGVTREVWMVHDGHLFQIVTPIKSQEKLASILES